VKGDKIAYEIKTEDGHPIINEKMADGTIIETHHEGDTFETGEKVQNYEKIYHAEHQSAPDDVNITENHETQTLEQTTEPTLASTPESATYQAPDNASVLTESAHNTNATAEELRKKIEEQINNPPKTLPKNKEMLEPIAPHEIPHEFVQNNPFHLSAGKLAEAHKAFEYNKVHMFLSDQGEPMEKWNDWKDLGASKLLDNQKFATNPKYELILNYLRKLSVASGLKPKGASIFHWRGESNEHFVTRALQRAAQLGTLDQIKP
jgi:hypothetical protein